MDILIERADGARTVRVRDDGVGGANAIRGSGLVGLPDKVEAVGGGTMALDSPPGAGTVLTVRLPSPRKVIYPDGQWCIPARCVPAEECVLVRGCAARPRA